MKRKRTYLKQPKQVTTGKTTKRRQTFSLKKSLKASEDEVKGTRKNYTREDKMHRNAEEDKDRRVI